MSNSRADSARVKLSSIQVLRGLAAAMVVFHHFGTSVNFGRPGAAWIERSGLGLLGQSGVDLFFTISGFIMVYTTTRYAGWSDAGRFMEKRLRRIYPLYWIWTSILLLLWILGIADTGRSFSPAFIFASYLLFPRYSAQTHNFHPMLSMGWTLSFEMLFYIVFAMTIAWVARRCRPVALVAAFLASGLASMLFPAESGLHYLLSNRLIIEFLLGVLAAELVLSGKLRGEGRFFRVLPILLMITGALGLLATVRIGFSEQFRFLEYGGPSFFIVLGAALWHAAPTHRLLVYFGDASYSIYLSQWVFTLPVARLEKHGSMLQHLPPDLMIILCTIVTIPLASLFYLLIEKRLLKWLPSPRERKAVVAEVTVG